MTELPQDFQPNYAELTADIVSAYVSNNSVPVGSLGELLSNVHAAISGLAAKPASAPALAKAESATPGEIRRSITHDFLISFEDGKRYKTLRRHLAKRGLTPETYRVKHGLPADYPMVSASYSAQRSDLARALGLGQQRQKKNQAPTVYPERAAPEEAVPVPKKSSRAGRARKATTA